MDWSSLLNQLTGLLALAMESNSLVLLRVVGGLLGVWLVIGAFRRFRRHVLKRGEYLLFTALGVGVLAVVASPDLVNTLAGMFALQDKQFGRLITLLILSNMALWVIVIGLRGKDGRRGLQFDLLVRSLARSQFEQAQGYGVVRTITAIMPALNEAENLQYVLPRVPATACGTPLGALVVDDGSRDDTAEVARQAGVAVISNPYPRGGGAALRLGYDVARQGGARIVVTMDADGQHLPEEIEGLVAPIIEGKYDFVIGSRVLGRRERDSIVRLAGIHFFNFLINLLAGTHITDCSSGFRAFRVDVLDKVLLLQDQFHTAELIIHAARRGVRIGEAPITVLRRHSGTSKKGKNLSYGVNFSKTVISTWLRD